jgi:hypothetical protein
MRRKMQTLQQFEWFVSHYLLDICGGACGDSDLVPQRYQFVMACTILSHMPAVLASVALYYQLHNTTAAWGL